MMKTDTIGYVGSFGGESVIVGVTEVADRLLQSHFDPARYHRLCEEARDAGMGIGRTPSEHPAVRLPDSCYWAYGAVVATCDASSAAMGGEGDLLCAVQIVCPMDDPCYGAVVPVVMDGSMTTIVSMGGPWFTAACESIEGWTDHARYFECGPFAQEDAPWDGIPDASALASLEEHWCTAGEQPSPAAVAPQRDVPVCKLSVPFRDATLRLQAKGWPDVIDMAVNAAADWPPMRTFDGRTRTQDLRGVDVTSADFDGPQPNTRIEYMNRDGGNYKTWCEAVVPGRLSEDDISEIVDGCLIDSEYFVPALVGLGDDGIDGGAWFELDRGSFTPTSEPPAGVAEGLTARSLLGAFRQQRDGLSWIRRATVCGEGAGDVPGDIYSRAVSASRNFGVKPPRAAVGEQRL